MDPDGSGDGGMKETAFVQEVGRRLGYISRNSSETFKLEVLGISLLRRQRMGGVHHVFVGYGHGHADAAINSRDMLKHIVEIRDPQGS